MKTAYRYLVLGLLALVAGCATCESCRAQASAQAPQPPAVPSLPPLPPLPSPGAPRDSFATLPTDDDEADPEVAVTPKKKPARVRVSKSREVDGEAVVIDQSGGGTVIVNSQGYSPATSAPASQMAMPTSYMVPAQASYPIIPGPLPDAAAVGLAKRVGGSLWYLVTGKCPTKPAAGVSVPVTTTGFATAPSSMMMVPAQSMAMMPVQQMSYVPAQAPMQAVFPASYQPQAAPAPTVVYMTAPAPAQSFAPMQAVPLASPQAPKKSLFHRAK